MGQCAPGQHLVRPYLLMLDDSHVCMEQKFEMVVYQLSEPNNQMARQQNMYHHVYACPITFNNQGNLYVDKFC
jgi:hypothetical protein